MFDGQSSPPDSPFIRQRSEYNYADCSPGIRKFNNDGSSPGFRKMNNDGSPLGLKKFSITGDSPTFKL
jgi:hypothetical protein